jgi:N-acylglucosamine-6-phosphate 2-epimerase/N-acetylmuramic acid 6-phosphate etherase
MTGLIARGALIVSCQARVDNPLHGPVFMGAMAEAARQGGAGALRVNGPEDVEAAVPTGLPIIGIHKIFSPGFSVYITPSYAAAAELVEAGADIVALDCTDRPRDGDPPADIIRRLSDEGVPAFADISTLSEGIAAEQMGASYVSSTLSGYTGAAPDTGEPNLKLIEELARRLSVPVIAEGRFSTPALARAALEAGAHAVVVGTAITDPREITRAFASVMSAG